MKIVISTTVFILFTLSMFGQRIVFPGQNQLYRFLEDPSYISSNGEYNMTGLLQVSDSDIAQTSQYLAAQLSFFDNIAFGVDYSRHSFDSYRYSHILFSSRVRLGLGSEFHFFNLGFSIGPDKSNQVGSAIENNITTSYRLAGHYTNFNLTIGGFLNRYQLQNESLINNNTQIPTTTDGYSIYASYHITLSDNLRLTPTVRYNSYDDLSFVEGIAMFNYKGKVEMAISYKNDYSINPELSARIFKRIKLSYSFEKSMGAQNFNDVHALGLSVNLGSKETDAPEWLANVKKKNTKIQSIKKKKTEAVEPVVTENHLDEEKVEDIKEELHDDSVVVAKTDLIKPMSQDDPEDTLDNHLKPGNYIVLGSFKVLENATKEVERLKRKGYYARIGKKNATDDFNYVYVDRYTDRNVALERIKEIQKQKGLEKTWVLSIE
ncbi:PorP/SprF family type IX secretion system membrane protein [Confluentibacter sediminis]|uniref:PorP/SprF family type IX secretion system membrane protein n=1 Tax=Confluentibacter sediminis TaxID=2219045 RepID=UPI000DAC47AA|nr:TonB-dependent receptor [Confluentibacter sediminis]